MSSSHLSPINALRVKRKERPSWAEYYLDMADLVARRSIDKKKYGCVMVCRQSSIPIAFGFNGWGRGMEEDEEMMSHPYKRHIAHAERNCLDQCMVNPWLLNKGAAVFISGRVCPACFNALANSNVREIYANAKNTMYSAAAEDYPLLMKLIKKSSVAYHEVELI